MSKNDFQEVLRALTTLIIVAVIVGVIVVGVTKCVAVTDAISLAAREQQCNELGERVGRRTKLIGEGYNACHIEIVPGYFVPENEVKFYLDFVKPVPR